MRLRDKDAPALLASLDRLASALGVTIPYEPLDQEGEHLRDRRVLFVESPLTQRDK